MNRFGKVEITVLKLVVLRIDSIARNGGVVGYVQQCRLIGVEFIHPRIDGRREVPTVAVAAPPEIEMEIVACHSVAHKHMPSLATNSTIKNREPGSDIGTHCTHPFIIRHSYLVSIVGRCKIIEVIGQSGTYIVVVGATSIGAIFHINRHAAVIHQFCDSFDLFRGAGTREGVRHVVEVVGGVVVVDGEGAVGAVIEAM